MYRALMLLLAFVVCLGGRAAAQEAESAIAQQIITDEAQVTKRFYDGPLDWYFQPGGNSLTMRGYTSSTNGGTVDQVTVCLYNESLFSRNFTATAAVVQGGSTIQEVPFTRSFPGQDNLCHTLNGFNAVVHPGAFEIQASFNTFDADNIFAGMTATEDGAIFDVQIGSQRPPFATGDQGPIQMHGVGLGFRINENEGPPPTCVPSDTGLCLSGDRFKVEATFNTGAQQGQAKVVELTPDTGYLWFFANTNVEAVVKVLDACGLNQKFWVFAGGLTNVNTVIKVTDTQTGAVKTYTNPQGTAFKPIQDTSAFSCQ